MTAVTDGCNGTWQCAGGEICECIVTDGCNIMWQCAGGEMCECIVTRKGDGCLRHKLLCNSEMPVYVVLHLMQLYCRQLAFNCKL